MHFTLFHIDNFETKLRNQLSDLEKQRTNILNKIETVKEFKLFLNTSSIPSPSSLTLEGLKKFSSVSSSSINLLTSSGISPLSVSELEKIIKNNI